MNRLAITSRRTFHDRRTFGEWIARVAIVTDTDRIVFHDVAIRVHAARARAWIHALFILTRQISGASLVYDTLGTAIWRTADVIR